MTGLWLCFSAVFRCVCVCVLSLLELHLVPQAPRRHMPGAEEEEEEAERTGMQITQRSTTLASAGNSLEASLNRLSLPLSHSQRHTVSLG